MDSLIFTNLTNKYHDDIFRYRYRAGVIFFMEYNEKIFGALKPLIDDSDITDINCNGRDVWVNHCINGRYKVEDIEFTESNILSLARQISNTENKQFNSVFPEMSADLGDLRFHFTHDTFSVSGCTVSIRKTPVMVRINSDTMKHGNVEYLSDKARKLLESIIHAKMNTVICGLTGSGKTELVKWMMKFTSDSDRIITIEDTSELHLAEIYPTKDIVELKINENINYEESIKACMRMLPTWLLLSESRGPEVKDLLKSISTGGKICTTLHADNAHQIPTRILNMFEDNELDNNKIENMIYDLIDIGVHIRASFNKKTIRYVDQIVYFEMDNNGNRLCHEIYNVKKDKNGEYQYIYHTMPKSLKEKLEYEGIYIADDWLR